MHGLHSGYAAAAALLPLSDLQTAPKCSIEAAQLRTSYLPVGLRPSLMLGLFFRYLHIGPDKGSQAQRHLAAIPRFSTLPLFLAADLYQFQLMNGCVEQTMIVPFALFWLGALVTILMIRKVNAFSAKDTMRAAIGMLGYKRTGAITIAQLTTLVVPMGLWLILIQNCKAAFG